MGTHHTLAGAIWMLGFMIYIDGAIQAKEDWKEPFVFVDTLGVILGVLGMILLAMTNVGAILGRNEDEAFPMMGGGDSDDAYSKGMTARILFFVGSFMMLTGFSITVWRLAGPFTEHHHQWGGWSQMLQTMVAMVSAILVVWGNAKANKRSDEM